MLRRDRKNEDWVLLEKVHAAFFTVTTVTFFKERSSREKATIFYPTSPTANRQPNSQRHPETWGRWKRPDASVVGWKSANDRRRREKRSEKREER